MKTLLFTIEYPPFKGGIANYYGNLTKYWPISEFLKILNNNHNELLVSGKGKFLAWWPALMAYKRYFDKEKPDYVLVGQILPLGTIVYFWSLFKPVKYAVFLHGMDFAYALKSPWKKFLASLILKRADKIIGANSYVASQVSIFAQNFEAKTAVINPGIISAAPIVNQNDYKNLHNLYNLEGKTVLLSIGRLVKRKGVDQVIEALRQISESEADNLMYFIAGIGPEEKYLRELVPPKFINKIIFLGELSEDEKWLWLNLCDIFIMPARNISGDYEGFGIVYLEANLCAKAVIAGDVGGVSDAVVNNYNGLLIDAEKNDNIREAILKLLRDPELRRNLGLNGQARAVRDFNWEKQVEKLVAVISDQHINK
jgi:phosphatidylinositol alpha-1,6-mannosyltransferase